MSKDTRTRFLIYTQSPALGPPFDKPERITVNRAPSEIAAGPLDVDTGAVEPMIYVLDAKKRRYDSETPHAYLEFDGRPWTGAKHRAVEPNADGHFDHLDSDEQPRHFAQASVYASVRFTLECWQKYFKKVRGGPIKWHHQAKSPGINAHLELNPWSSGNGARAGYGFIEFGTSLSYGKNQFYRGPLWKNFDVVAHEFGHCLLFAKVGFPKNLGSNVAWYSRENLDRNGDFLAFHESAGDLVAMVSSLHHDTVIDHLLKNTGGNLRGGNVIARIGELRNARSGDLGQMFAVRNAANSKKLGDVSIRKDGPHIYSLPLTSAIYDVFVDVFEQQKATLAKREALLEARDYLGQLLARAWSQHVSADNLTFAKVRKALLAADKDVGGEQQKEIKDRFTERGIG